MAEPEELRRPKWLSKLESGSLIDMGVWRVGMNEMSAIDWIEQPKMVIDAFVKEFGKLPHAMESFNYFSIEFDNETHAKLREKLFWIR